VGFFVGSGGNGLARGAREIVARIAAGAVIDGLRFVDLKLEDFAIYRFSLKNLFRNLEEQ